MTALAQPASTLTVSEQLRKPLREVARRRWIVVASKGLLQTLAGALGVLLAAALLLGELRLPVPARIALAAIAWIIVIWVAARFLRPALRRWNLSRAARQVEVLFPHLQERLSSAVELAHAREDPALRGSPQLISQLIRQAEADAAAINPAAVVPVDPVVRWGVICFPLLVAWLVLALNSHTAQPVLRGLYSTFFPWESHVPAVLEQLRVRPGDVTLAEGDPLEITARINATRDGLDTSASGAAELVRRYSTGQTVSQPLERAGPRDLRARLDHVQQGFDYQIKTDQGASEWFTATVHPRPAIARLDVRYEAPAYTGLAPRTVVASDGNLEALVGTRVTLIVHIPDPPASGAGALVMDRCRVVLDEGGQQQQVIPLAEVTPTEYQASFTVARSDAYRIHLLNAFGLENRDNQPRPITALFDQPPTVIIESPTGQVTVRPDDTVPVEYVAADDFGIASMDALVAVDDAPARRVRLKLPSAEPHLREARGTWNIEVAKLMAAAHVKDASRITYQLRATDNRDPDPQSGLSARQVLIIDRGQWRSYADQLNEQRKRLLEEAIRRAIDRLHDTENRNNRFQWFDNSHSLTPDERKEARDLRELLATTSRDLSTSAGEFLTTPFAQVARAAKEVADVGIAHAADDVARCEFSADDPPQRKYIAQQAHQKIIDARQQLEKLIELADQAERKFQAMEALEQAARKQQEAAQAMAEHPEDTDQGRQRQQEAINKLNEAIQKDQVLQDPQAKELAQHMAELTQKIEQDQEQQTKLQNASSKLAEARQATDAARTIAKQQRELNDRIAAFAKREKDALQQSGTEAPHDDQQRQIVERLEKGELHDAGEAMRNAANAMKDSTRHLQEQSRSSNPNLSASQQEQKQKDEQNAQQAHVVQDQAKQSADNLNREADQNAIPPKDSGGIHSAHDAADAIAKQADAIQSAAKAIGLTDDVKSRIAAAQAQAKEAAGEAQQAASAADAKAARKLLHDAAAQIRRAGDALVKAADAEARTSAKRMAANNKQADAAAAGEAMELSQRQDALAKLVAPQETQLADARRDMLPADQTAAQQHDLAHQTQDLRDGTRQLAEQATKQQDPALAQRAADARQALDHAAQAQQHAADAHAKQDVEEASNAQAEAQQALSKADLALRGNPRVADAEAGDAPESNDGKDASAAVKPNSQDDANMAQRGTRNGAGSPAEEKRQAARSAQEAAAAQQQAMRPNAAAAQQAADALARAAAASAAAQQATAGRPDASQAMSGDPSGAHAADNADVSNGEKPGVGPGQSAEAREGIRGQTAGGNNAAPASVQDMGISAADWARLPPLMQRELMNASQQTGPPAYRQMIRDYYVRIARMQDGTGSR